MQVLVTQVQVTVLPETGYFCFLFLLPLPLLDQKRKLAETNFRRINLNRGHRDPVWHGYSYCPDERRNVAIDYDDIRLRVLGVRTVTLTAAVRSKFSIGIELSFPPDNLV